MPHPSSLAASPKPPVLAFVWDNFGPLHDDRVAATARLLAGRAEVVGVEINGRSDVYSWANEATSAFRKVTLLPDSDLGTTPDHVLFSRTLASLRQLRATHVFLCHYERRGIAGLAYVLRATGRKVFVMGCSKFDDHPRSAVREALKLPFLWPYQGGLVGSEQTRAFLAFLGRRSMPMELRLQHRLGRSHPRARAGSPAVRRTGAGRRDRFRGAGLCHPRAAGAEEESGICHRSLCRVSAGEPGIPPASCGFAVMVLWRGICGNRPARSVLKPMSCSTVFCNRTKWRPSSPGRRPWCW